MGTWLEFQAVLTFPDISWYPLNLSLKLFRNFRGNFYIPFLLLMNTFCFTCGKKRKKIVKHQRSQNIMTIIVGKILTYHERIPPLKPHDPLILWPICGHVKIWKIYIFTFMRLMVTKLAGCWLWGEGSACKCLSHYQLLAEFWE